MPTEKKPFAIESGLFKYIPVGASGARTAKFTLAGSKVVIELDKSITLNIAKEELGIDFGKSLSGVLTFDDAGKLFSYELAAAPKASTAPRVGAPARFFEQR